MGNPYGGDLVVDQVIGSAYVVVKYVAANMEMLIQLSESIPTLASYIPYIQEILLHLDAVEDVSANMVAVTNVSTNMAVVTDVATNMAALLAIYGDLASILAVPAYISALDWKPSVRVATTANIVLSGLQTIDGVVLVAGDRVLVKNQGAASDNGIYVAAAGSWSRASDSAGTNVTTNNMVVVDSGTVAAGKLFRLSTVGAITVGTTAITWTEFTPPNGSETITGMVRFATDMEFAAGANGVAATPEQVQELVGSIETGGGESNTLANEGTGESLVGTKTGSALGVKSVKAGSNMTIVDDGAGSLVFNSTASGGGGGGELADGDYGDLTVSESGSAMTINEGVVTNAKLADVVSPAFKGRTAAGTGAIEDLTPTEVTAALNSFSVSLKGLVPAPVTTSTRFLMDDGNWVLPLDAVGSSSGSGVIDALVAQVAQRTLTADTTISFTNMVSGRSITLHLESAGHVVTWPVGMKWVGVSAPTLTTSDVLVFWQVGSQLYGSYVGNIV